MDLLMDADWPRKLRVACGLLILAMLASCGGGGGGSYTISAMPSAVHLTAYTSGRLASQTITITFDGESIGGAPEAPSPAWLVIEQVSYTSNTVVLRLLGDTLLPAGTYTTKLQLATTRRDGSHPTFLDVPVTFTLLDGRSVDVRAYGLPTNGSVTARLDNEDPVTLTTDTTPVLLGAAGVGNNYTVNVSTQPPGQHCTFPNESPALSDVIGSGSVSLRLSCNASLVPWTWAGGTQSLADVPAYPPARGGSGASYRPGGRFAATHAVDAQGNLWLFGGRDPAGLHNDLWRLDPVTRQWTWVAGSALLNAAGAYGSKGTPSTSNSPGARTGAASWFDANGDFWLFGGSGFASASGTQLELNDLWKYDVSDDTWTWAGGSGTSVQTDAVGTYSTTPSTTNIPGGRHDMTVVRDAAGAVWLFGGQGLGAASFSSYMGDLWKFDPATLVWSWMSGSNQPNVAPVQGSLGVPDPANVPGGRSAAGLWADGSGNLWMFGGIGVRPQGQPENDLWRFNIATRTWTWMSGVDRSKPSLASRGVYNPPGASGNLPSSRAGVSIWLDAAGNFWMFGGFAQSPHSADYGPINDLWKYSPATNAWSWESGAGDPGQPSVHGAPGIAANTNVPGARQHAMAWMDASGRLWLFGGAATFNAGGGRSDLWFATP
jgi:N-acetylneuraminic acid mutarotase